MIDVKRETAKAASPHDVAVILRTLDGAIEALQKHPAAQEILKQKQRLLIHRWTSGSYK